MSGLICRTFPNGVSKMKVRCIIPVVGILTFNFGFSEEKILEESKITNSINLHLGLISYSTVLQIILCNWMELILL